MPQRPYQTIPLCINFYFVDRLVWYPYQSIEAVGEAKPTLQTAGHGFCEGGRVKALTDHKRLGEALELSPGGSGSFPVKGESM